MAGESLIIGNGNWGVKSGNLLGYNLNNAKYVPRELTFTRATTGTRTNGALLVESTPLSTPRIDYSTGTAALLMEPQRTNIVLRSEEFDSASWARLGATVIANDTTAPNGLLVADKITQSGATVNFSQSISLPAGVVTFTTYVKKGNFDSSSGFLFGFFSTITADVGYISFSFLTGTTTVYSGTFISHSATNVGNGWYRIQGTINIPSAGTGYFYNGGIGLNIAGVGSYYYSWGAQVEAGSFATSYIPTVGASVTRNADVLVQSGISNFIGQTEGTLFIDFIFKIPQSNLGGQIAVTSNSGSIFDRVVIWNNFTTNTLAALVQANNATVYNISLGTFVDGTQYKIAIAYKSGDSVFYVNGVQIGSSSASFSFSATLTTFILGAYESSSFGAHQRNNSSIIFMNRLSNAELAILTTK